MKRLSLCLFGLLAGALAVTPVSAENAGQFSRGDKASPFMRVFGPSQPPYGFVRFCETTPEACQPQRIVDVRFQPTPERLSELDDVNRNVNRTIKPATDMEIYGVSEYWTHADRSRRLRGLCASQAEVLAERGWPMSALLITVVRDEKGEGHALLTVRTAQGDFLLDNKVDDVRLWNVRTTNSSCASRISIRACGFRSTPPTARRPMPSPA